MWNTAVDTGATILGRAVRIVPIVLIAILGSACSRVQEENAADTSLSLAEEWVLPPRGIAEVNLRLSSGDQIRVAFSADGEPLHWDVHSHPTNDEVVVHTEGRGMTGDFGFTAPQAGAFSVLWRNESDDVTVPFDATITGKGELIDVMH